MSNLNITVPLWGFILFIATIFVDIDGVLANWWLSSPVGVFLLFI